MILVLGICKNETLEAYSEFTLMAAIGKAIHKDSDHSIRWDLLTQTHVQINNWKNPSLPCTLREQLCIHHVF